MKKIFAASALIAAISGCASTGVNVQPAQLTEFKQGITTDADVIRALGSPTASSSSSEGAKTLIYSFAQAKIRGTTFIPIVGLFAGGSDINANSTIFTFDKDGKMLSYTTSQSQYGTTTGLASGAAPQATSQPR